MAEKPSCSTAERQQNEKFYNTLLDAKKIAVFRVYLCSKSNAFNIYRTLSVTH